MHIKVSAYTTPVSTLADSNKASIHPRIINAQQKTTEDVINQIESNTTLTHADISAAIVALRGYLEDHLSEGNSIKLDGLGTFSIVPQFVVSLQENAVITGRDVNVKSINFLPDKDFFKTVQKKAKFTIENNYHKSKYSEEDIISYLKEHFNNHNFLYRKEFIKDLNLCPTKAYTLLNDLVDKKVLTVSKVGNTNVYKLL